MCPERLVSNVFGFNIDTMAFLEEWGFSTQSADDAMKGALHYLEKCGFSSSPPDKLYRYRSPKHMVDEITDHYVYYSPATTMTDPYDCLFSSRRALKKIGLWYDDYDEIFDDKDLESMINDLIRDQINICCFSESYTSFAMWDQYAAGHRGICIEYDSKKLLDHITAPMKVKYSKNSFRRFNNSAVDATELLLGHLSGCTLTKNRDYRHEQEWRSFGVGGHKISIDDAISCVYIGSRCSKGKNKVIRACKDQGIDIIKLTVRDDNYSFLERKI